MEFCRLNILIIAVLFLVGLKCSKQGLYPPEQIDYDYVSIKKATIIKYDSLNLYIKKMNFRHDFVFKTADSTKVIHVEYKKNGISMGYSGIYYSYDKYNIYSRNQQKEDISYPFVNKTAELLDKKEIKINKKTITVFKYYELYDDSDLTSVLSFWIKDWGPIMYYIRSAQEAFIISQAHESVLTSKDIHVIKEALFKDKNFIEMSPIPPLPQKIPNK
ncbi:MAG TPA: hypothetical protein PKC76_12220 [Saprospiraceae bacterium]|nr:hypothetical protein [Saprospiraceae bacterium]